MIKLRIASTDDAPALAKIYSYYVNNTTISFEYEAPSIPEFAHRIEHKMEKYPYIVAEKDGVPIGYAYASSLRERRAYDWATEVSVYVDKEHCHCGVGRRLYSALLDILKEQNFETVYACITFPNEPSVSFHEKLGFEKVGQFKAAGYKMDRWCDVLWYEKHIGECSSPSPVIPFPELDKEKIKSILK